MDNTKVVKKYDNGAVLIYNQHNEDNTTRACIGFKTGARTDGELLGLTHFLEHILFKNITFSKKAPIKYARGIGGEQNAFTTLHFVGTEFSCTNDKFEKMLSNNIKILKNRKFTEEDVNNEREVIKQEMYMVKDRTSFYKNLLSILQINGYDQTEIVGTEETLDSITRQDLVEHADITFLTDNMIIAINSSLPFEDIELYLEQYVLGVFPTFPQLEVKQTIPLYNSNQNRILLAPNKNLQTCRINVMFKNKNDFFTNLLMQDFENFYFNANMKMHDAFRETDQLCYTASMYDIPLENLTYKNFEVLTSPNKVNKCLEVLSKMIKNVSKKGISQEDFEAFKNYVKNSKKYTPSILPSIDPLTAIETFILYGDAFIRNTYRDLQNLTFEQINNYMKNAYSDSNVILYFSGNIDKDKLFDNNTLLNMFDAKKKMKLAKNMDFKSLLDKHFLDINTEIASSVYQMGNQVYFLPRDIELATAISNYKREEQEVFDFIEVPSAMEKINQEVVIEDKEGKSKTKNNQENKEKNQDKVEHKDSPQNQEKTKKRKISQKQEDKHEDNEDIKQTVNQENETEDEMEM